MNQDILQFAENINRHGYAMRLTSIKNGVSTSLVSAIKPINEITEGQPLYLYLENTIKSLDPDQLIAEVKQRNGSSFKNPKTFIYKKIIQDEFNLAGVNINNPITQVYQFQIETLNKELSKITADRDKHEAKHEKFKEKYYECKKQLELIEDRHQLKLEKTRLENENTLTGVLKEFKPEIQATLSGLAGKFGDNENEENQNNQLAGPGVDPNTKIGVLLNIFNSLDEEMFNLYWEIIARLGQIPQDDKNEILENLRDKTESFNQAFNESNQLKIK